MIKDIAGYEGIYAIDDMGNVYSYKFGKVKKLKPALGKKHKYLYVVLSKDGIKKTLTIHRLLAKAFLSDYSDDLEVDHIDINRANNKLSNLRMVTPQQNAFNNSAKGYTWNKNKSKWQAQIKKDGKMKYLGYFDKEEDARAAYLEAKKIYHII